ncbi:hypothetical protein FALBO_5785 [Fusarium albosuccineum]|uniref:Uncharacterized protein n=1 Tax=Fusarium albosuccineum TaxID=1237068 RepID=A0A8H4PDY4_9HYPO|nr:hypothetical protein FALBO_5785 [Fusarium albosuccineum]
MPETEYRIIFEYPHLGRGVVSDSPPGVKAPGDGPTFGPDPEAQPYDDDSGTDEEDYEIELDSDDDEDDLTRVPWHPHALHFLAQVPQNDASWSRQLSSNGDLRSLCHRLRVPLMYPEFQAHLNWKHMFAECAWHLARACNDPPVASLFSLVFVAACHVALMDGCPRDIVMEGLRSCVRQCGVRESELTEPMLERMREGVVAGIQILREYVRIIGNRANEIPLHAQGCLQLFRHYTPACASFIRRRIPMAYRPTTLLQSQHLEIPALVYDTLGGEHSKWEYQDICRMLRTDWDRGDEMPELLDVDMTFVMEFDENEDDEEDGKDQRTFTIQRVYS